MSNDLWHGDETIRWHSGFEPVSVDDVMQSIVTETNTPDGQSSYDWIRLLSDDPDFACAVIQHIATHRNKPEFAYLVAQLQTSIRGHV